MAHTKITEQDENFLTELIPILQKDPSASEYIKNYPKTKEYLMELIEKDGSILGGIINAIEYYLDK